MGPQARLTSRLVLGERGGDPPEMLRRASDSRRPTQTNGTLLLSVPEGDGTPSRQAREVDSIREGRGTDGGRTGTDGPLGPLGPKAAYDTQPGGRGRSSA